MSFPHFCQNLLHLHLLLYSKALEWDKLKWIYASEQKNSGSNFPEIFLKYSLQKSKLHGIGILLFLISLRIPLSIYRSRVQSFSSLMADICQDNHSQISIKALNVKPWYISSWQRWSKRFDPLTLRLKGRALLELLL